MRVLVVGTVPPPGGAPARRLAAAAAELVDAGHEVEILSPDPRSAAHAHGALAGPMLALQLARRARRFDAAVVNFEPGLPLSSGADRATRAVTLVALGIALRGFGEVTIRLPSPIPIPGGVGGRASRELWSRTTGVVLEHAEDLDRILEAPGMTVERVRVDAGRPAGVPPGEPGWRGLTGTEVDLRELVQAAVRERAARDRLVNAARVELGARSGLATPADPFADGPPARAAGRPDEIARLVLARCRRPARRLLSPLRGSP